MENEILPKLYNAIDEYARERMDECSFAIQLAHYVKAKYRMADAATKEAQRARHLADKAWKEAELALHELTDTLTRNAMKPTKGGKRTGKAKNKPAPAAT